MQPISSVSVVAFGGGLNSTALLVGMHERGQCPDAILFADTGGERPETYAHVDAVRAWCERVSFPPLVTVRYGSRLYSSLEDECLKRGMLPELAYGYHRCAGNWKRRPQELWISRWSVAREAWGRGELVTKVLGFDAGEERRAQLRENKQYCYSYPLLEWGWFREECAEACARAGFDDVPKSACFFCPATRKPEILELRQKHPTLYGRAIAIERRAAPNSLTVLGLGRRFSWEEYVAQVDASSIEEASRCGGPDSLLPVIPCGCYDEEAA